MLRVNLKNFKQIGNFLKTIICENFRKLFVELAKILEKKSKTFRKFKEAFEEIFEWILVNVRINFGKNSSLFFEK